MNLAQQFNSLNGMIVSRKTLELLLEKAEKEKHAVISKRVLKVLEAFQDDTFLIEINNLVEPFGLNGKQHTGLEKEALDDCGRLTKGHKYRGGKVVKVAKKTIEKVKLIKNQVVTNLVKDQEKTKEPGSKPVLTKSTSRLKEKFSTRYSARLPLSSIKSKEKVLSIPDPVKVDKNGQYALLGAVKKGLNAPKVEVKPIAKEKTAIAPKVIQNKDSLAYRLANKKQNHEFYKIQDRDIAEFLGEIEQKEKESVVITLAGGEGSMKTRMLFQLMNAFAQKYKCGHASLEEHPESVLYENKALEYLNQTALQNVSAPEIENLTQLDQIIRENEVVFIDSFAKLKKMDSKFDLDTDLRKKYNGKLFIIIFQLTTNGKMRGGSTSQFDGDIILFTEKLPDYRNNYIYADKNRYQNKPLDGLKFNIFNKKLVQDTPEATAEPTTKRKLSFVVN